MSHSCMCCESVEQSRCWLRLVLTGLCLWCAGNALCLQVHHSEKKQALLDLLSVHAAGGKAIVFTRTKMGADEVAAAISQQQPCEALHGDIPQNQREKTLGRFRAGACVVFPRPFFSFCALCPAPAMLQLHISKATIHVCHKTCF